MSIRPTAKGIFTLDPQAQHHFMVATVTGVAPFVSMLRSFLYQGWQGHRFCLLQGASYRDELTYYSEMARLAAQYPDHVTYVPTVSRPQEARNTGWKGAKGRVNLIVEEYLEKFNPPQEDTVVYTCGHPGMIADVKAKVVPQGWRYKEERFWKQ